MNAKDVKGANIARQVVCLGYGAIITFTVTAQLFSLDIIAALDPFKDFAGRLFLVGMIVASVFSLPYVLDIKVSQLMRLVAFAFAMIVPSLWLMYSIVTLETSEVGIFGAYVTQGWIAFVWAIGGGLLAISTMLIRGVPKLKIT